ncbi:MAG: cyclopropane fatty acyl phospholipid synthase [Acidiferrobacterales bacterium]|nr:cyclopropane fatty acyl phospholipid synthase [Acidiferrobacterales bacterium]
MAKTSIKPAVHGSLGFAGRVVQSMLDEAGIVINGSNPWDIQIKDPALFKQILTKGSLALGEGYVDKKWEVEQVDELICRMLRSSLAKKTGFFSHQINRLKAIFFNLQQKSRAFQVGEEHYDLGNDIYEVMLDPRMVYTCGYWNDAKDLASAQENKLELVCRKLNLQPGMRVLDIGCGWGSFAQYAIEKYDVEVVGVTVSKEQAALAKKRCAGLSAEIRLQDYRDITEKFDAVVSLGMFEHVGHKNYRTYMQVLNHSLKPGSLALLHTIGKNHSTPGVDPWISRYIFPNGEIPSLLQISKAMEPDLMVEDLHNIGPDYDKTLMSWFRNFEAGWEQLQNNYSERFYRMWTYYLRVCAGAFRARDLQLWQLVISRGDNSTYRRPFY